MTEEAQEEIGVVDELDQIRKLLSLETARSVYIGELRPDWMGVAAEVVTNETVTGTIIYVPGVSLSELNGLKGTC